MSRGVFPATEPPSAASLASAYNVALPHVEHAVDGDTRSCARIPPPRMPWLRKSTLKPFLSNAGPVSSADRFRANKYTSNLGPK